MEPRSSRPGDVKTTRKSHNGALRRYPMVKKTGVEIIAVEKKKGEAGRRVSPRVGHVQGGLGAHLDQFLDFMLGNPKQISDIEELFFFIG